MLVLGVDPGSRACGYALVTMEGNRFVRVGGGVIKPRGETVPRKLAALQTRMERMQQTLAELNDQQVTAKRTIQQQAERITDLEQENERLQEELARLRRQASR